MAHNINFNKEKGTHSFVSVKEKAWHQLGQTVDKAMTSKEAIELANLDYEVALGKLAVVFGAGYDPRSKYIPNMFSTFRTDTCDTFGIVSDSYKIVQNRDAFMFMDSIVGEGKAIYETAGALGKGETIFITAKLPYYIKVNGWDTIENYLVISSGHDGKSSVRIFLTPVRIVCENTLSIGIQSAKFMFNIRHTSGVNDKLEDANNILKISKSITEETQELYQELANIQINDKQFTDYMNSIFLTKDELTDLAKRELTVNNAPFISTKKKNIIHSVNTFYHSGLGQEKIIGTAYGAYNAINGWLSNVKTYKAADKKMESLVMGGKDYNINAKALELALTLKS